MKKQSSVVAPTGLYSTRGLLGMGFTAITEKPLIKGQAQVSVFPTDSPTLLFMVCLNTSAQLYPNAAFCVGRLHIDEHGLAVMKYKVVWMGPRKDLLVAFDVIGRVFETESQRNSMRWQVSEYQKEWQEWPRT